MIEGYVNCIQDLILDELVAVVAGLQNSGIQQVEHQEGCQIVIHTILEAILVLGLQAGDVNVNGVGRQQSVRIDVNGSGSGNGAVSMVKIDDDLAEGELDAAEGIVVTQNNDGCIGVNLVQHENGLGILDLEVEVAVEVRLNSQGHHIQNGNLGGEVSSLAQCLGLRQVLQEGLILAQTILVLIDQIHNIDADGSGLGNTGSHQSCTQLSAGLVNQVQVALAYDSSPIHLHNGCALEEHSIAVNGAVHKISQSLVALLLHDIREDGIGQSFSIIQSGSSQSGIHVVACEAHHLVHSEGAQVVLVKAHGDQVSLSQLSGIQVVPGLVAEAVSGQAQVLSQEISVQVAVTGNGNVVGILGYGVLTGAVGIQVSLDSIPSILTEHLSQTHNNGQSLLGIVQQELSQLGAVGSDSVVQNLQQELIVSNQECAGILVQGVQEGDHSLGSIGEVLDDPSDVGIQLSAQLGDVVSQLVGSIDNHLLVGLISLDGDLLVLSDSGVDSGNYVVLNVSDQSVQLGDGSLDLGVQLGDSSLNLSIDLSDGSGNLSLDLGDSGLDLSLDLCDSGLDLSLDLCDSSGQLSLNLCDSSGQLSLNAGDLSQDSISCSANGSLQLGVQDSQLLLSLGIQDSDLLLSLGIQDSDLLLSLCVQDSDLLLSLCVQGNDLLPSLGVNDSDLLLGLSIELSDVGVSVTAGVNNHDTQQGSQVSGVGCEQVQQLECILVGLLVQLVSVVDQSASSLDGSSCVIQGSVNGVNEGLASCQVSILVQPSLSVVHSDLSDIQVLVDLLQHTGGNSLLVSNGVDLLVVLAQQLSNLQQVSQGLLLSGMVGLVSLNDSLVESVVSRGSGVNGHTVTNLEQSVDLNHCTAGSGSIEPCANVGLKGQRGVTGDRGIAKCIKGTVACDTHQTVNGDVHGIHVHGNSLLQSQIDGHGDFLVDLGFKLSLNKVGILHVGNRVALIIQQLSYQRICGAIHKNHHEESLVGQDGFDVIYRQRGVVRIQHMGNKRILLSIQKCLYKEFCIAQNVGQVGDSQGICISGQNSDNKGKTLILSNLDQRLCLSHFMNVHIGAVCSLSIGGFHVRTESIRLGIVLIQKCAKIGCLSLVGVENLTECGGLLHILSDNDVLIAVDLLSSLEGLQLGRIDLGESVRTTEEAPADHLADVAVEGVDLSAADDGTGQTAVLANGGGITVGASNTVSVATVDVVPVLGVQVVKGLNDELGGGLLGVVEGGLNAGVNNDLLPGLTTQVSGKLVLNELQNGQLVLGLTGLEVDVVVGLLLGHVLTGELLSSGDTGDVCVQGIEHGIHHVAEGELEDNVAFLILLGEVHTVGGIHETDQDDLHVGVQLYDTIENGLVVDQEAGNGICKDTQSGIDLLGLESLGSIGQVRINFLLEIRIGLQNDLLSLLGLENSQGLLQSGSLSSILLGEVGIHQDAGNTAQQERTEGCITDTEGHDVGVHNGGDVVVGQLLDSLGGVVVTVATVLTGIGVVQNLLEPIVSRGLAATQEVQQILCTESRSSQLGVIYSVALLSEVVLELESVGACTVDVNIIKEVILVVVQTVTIQVILVTLVIAVKAVTVGHRIADGNVVQFVVEDIVLNAVSSNRDHGRANSHEHGQSHNQRKYLQTHS